MSDTLDCDVLVIGAGLAGLQCARTLQRAGVHTQVWEAGDAVGGRIRTDRVDGFLMDRGFQVLNPAYPAVQRHIDVEALQLQTFGSGALVRREDRLAVLADPLREPAHLPDVLRSGYLVPQDLLALARWAGPAVGPSSAMKAGPDTPRSVSLDAAGLHGDLRRVVEEFLAGVLLEDDGSTSTAFTRLLVRMFAFGSPGLPASGMQALPQQIADRLHAPVRLGTRVRSVDQGTGRATVHADGLSATARLVVVATGAGAAEELVGLTAPATKGVVTDWFTMPEPPAAPRMLVLDGRTPSGGPVRNAAVITDTAPSYAPPGQHMVQASSLVRDGRVPPVSDVLRHVGELYAVGTGQWELVHRHEVPQALPVQPPPLRLRRPMQVSESVVVAGDHMDTASIQGALVSGERAAQGWLSRTASRTGR
ncbi:NAD(P)/FAD-dependent oxidoreductase [Ornithinimicrobium sediminis]|uniref:NAD(P)/FAD-dependent oxidoreductase n=1 Tax=Ornithinimicrobium sediminis TaxID=2904603 RepID=UPI001E52B866|nr:NAD(P)/FAD-dependent oxidoreductase [Ornithinimicrobium sediminis]MCE0487181.1 FAD-dependent oxidoreductase [Ornithinimicrobium sediminis]